MSASRLAAALVRRARKLPSYTSISAQTWISPLRSTQLGVEKFHCREFSSGTRSSGEEFRLNPIRAIKQSARSYEYRAMMVAAAAAIGTSVVVLADEKKIGGASDPVEEKTEAKKEKKKVVVLGTGWAGMSFLKGIDTELYDVRVISPRNYFVFTPLIPSVTNGTVEARSIAEPIRRMCRSHKKDVQLYEAECLEIDPENKRLICRDVSEITVKGKEGFSVDYDYLVIAVGAISNTFGIPGVVNHCHFLKELEDAAKIRESIINCFESSSLPNLNDDDRKRMLSFVVVGGGPTGVEFAAELHDLVFQDMSKLYPDLQPLVSVTIIEAVDHILNSFDKRIIAFAEKKFQRDGLRVKTNCVVKKVNEGEVVYFDKAAGEEVSLPFGLTVWATGLGTRPVVTNFMRRVGQADSKVLGTDEWLRVQGCGDGSVYAIGDCATIEQRKITEDLLHLFNLADQDKSGSLSVEEFQRAMEVARERYPQIDRYMQSHHFKSFRDFLESDGSDSKSELDLEKFKQAMREVDSQLTRFPATAQVAAQQGAYLAKCFNHLPFHEENAEGPKRVRAEGYHRFKPFRYKHFGQFAPLGGEQAAAELPGDWISIGRSTQWLWYSVYASKQVSWRTRVLVLYDWTKRLFFGRDSSRM